MDLTIVAVPHTLAQLKPLLPPPPVRVLEAGCGRGALAAALGELGYQVTGVDRNAEMASAARELGVTVIEADVNDVSGEYDVVLFTRSLHHVESLDDTLKHAATLLAPGGHIVIEEFAWEQVDSAAATFVYDNRAKLVEAGVLAAALPAGDPLEAWASSHESLHRGSEMLAALSRVGANVETKGTAMLWRMLDGHGGAWVEVAEDVADALNAMREAEEQRIAAGELPAVGLLAAVRP